MNIEQLQLKGESYDFKLALDSVEDRLLLDINEFNYPKHNIKLSGNISATFEEIKKYQKGVKKDVVIENMAFLFDKELPPIKSNKTFIKMDGDDFYINFEKPTIDGIDLNKTNVALRKRRDYFVLDLDIYSKSIINNKIINLANYYGVDIPVFQHSGKNDINLKIKIPLKDNLETDLYLQANIKEGSFYFDDIKFNVKELYFLINDEKIYIKSNDNNLLLNEKKYKIKKLKTKIIDSKIYSTFDLFDETNNSFTIDDTTYLDKNYSKGIIYINHFNNNEIKIKNEKIDYKLKFKPITKIGLNGNIDVFFQNKPLKIQNLYVDIVGDDFNITGDVFDENNNSFTIYDNTNIKKGISSGTLHINKLLIKNSVKIDNQKVNFTLKHEPLKLFVTADINISLKEHKLFFNDAKIDFANNKLIFKSKIKTGLNVVSVDSIIDIDKKISNGKIVFNHLKLGKFVTLNNEKISYLLDFNDPISLEIPQFGLKYIKKDSNHNLLIKKLNYILNKINHITILDDKESRLELFSNNDFKSFNVVIDDLNVDINSTLFKSDKKEENSFISYPDMNIKIFNSSVVYDKKIRYDTSITKLKSTNNKLFIVSKPKNEQADIKINIFEKNYFIKANRLSDKFVNKILKKEWFKEGEFEIDLKGDKHNLNGTIKFKKTTIQNMRVLQNLIVFINTTPAIINPILTLPTLFRLSETGFDMSGYYVKKGHIKFNYDIDKNYTNIILAYTRSKMTDFKAKGYIDHLNEKISFNVDVIFLKDYSNAIKNIPILGYIITGDDGNFVTKVDIKGDFEEQSFETHAIKDASKGVFNVIKRTLSIPFLPFMNDNEDKKGEKR